MNLHSPSRINQDIAIAELEREEQRQREALKAFYARQRPATVPLPRWKAILIVAGVFALGIGLVLCVFSEWLSRVL